MKKINIILANSLSLPTSLLALPGIAFAANKSTSSNCQNSTQAGLQQCLKDNPIVHDLNLAVNFMSGLVGVVIIASIIYASIQYIIAGDNAQSVSAAKKRITDSIVALLAFVSIFALLQWLIPGGI